VANNTVLQQVETAYDDASNLIQTTTRNRFHDATGLGELTTPGGAQPKARVSYQALYSDGIGRTQAVADYGTNAAAAFARSAIIPARSDTVLVTSTSYNDRGEGFKVIDPQGVVNQSVFDNAARLTQLLENYVAGGTNPDQNRETDYTYNADGKVLSQTAKNSTTANQVTQYLYGTTLLDSDVASNDLLRTVIYPGDTGPAPDQVTMTYNRLGQFKTKQDQMGSLRMLQYDKLGRLQHDAVTTLGAGVDGAVRRISYSYDVRGMALKITSYDNATVGTGSIVNENQNAYDGFGLLTTDYQSHSGAVNTSTSPKVQYAMSDGSSNHARLTALIYPDGRVLSSDYGAAGGAGDVLNRINALTGAGPQTFVLYSYLGMDRTVIANYATQPGVELTYYTSGGSGDGGDQYTGLDRFDRVIDQRWRKTSDNSDRERVKYGFDRASNRLWRQNTVAATGQDEYYSYDGLYQLKVLQRGTLNAGKTGITGTPVWEEDFAFDPTGNWNNYLTKVSGTTSLNQNRTHNPANEIQTIAGSSSLITQNAAGNITKTPKPSDWGSAYDLTYDAWNRLAKVMAGASTVATFVYDGQNRRITKTVSGTIRHYYYSSQWQILEERVGASAIADRQFVWGTRYVDDLVLRDRGAERFYVLHDYFNCTAVVDTSGTVQERYGYEAFGQVRFMTAAFGSRSASIYEWETLYGAYRWDSESGVYQVRYRYLHATLGRWLTRDPLGEKDGSNLYFYVVNDPVNAIDVLGLTWDTPSSTVTPVELGWEWLTGDGPRHRDFKDGDNFAELLRQHDHIRNQLSIASRTAAQRCSEDCNDKDFVLPQSVASYSTSGFQGVWKYFKDYSSLLTFGFTGNLAVTFLGSYRASVNLTKINCCKGTAHAEIIINNTSRASSAARPPVIGYTWWWLKYVAPIIDRLFQSGGGSPTTQTIKLNEDVSFDKSDCPG
jgi:RHS repeat-associated protein